MKEQLISISAQKKKRHSETQRGFRINTIQAYLHLLKKEMNYSEVFAKGPIKHKKSFLRYLDYGLNHKLIERFEDWFIVMYRGEVVKRRKIRGSVPHVFYQTTSKGMAFLEMIK